MPGPTHVGVDLGGFMGLFDHLSGNTPKQKREKFYNERLPQIATEFFQADPTDRQAHAANGLKLMQEAAAAGLNEKQYETILNHLTAPARAKSAERVYDEINNDRQQRGGRMIEQDITGRAPLEGADDSLEAFRRQGDFNQDDAFKLGRAEAVHGIKIPAHLAENLVVPSRVAENNATKRLRQMQHSTERTQNRIADMQADELERLGNDQSLDAVGAGTVARATQGRGLAPYLDDERDRPSEVALRDAQGRYNDAGVRLRGAQVGTEGAQQRELGTRSQFNVARTNKTNDRTRDFADRGGSAGSETTVETERVLKPEAMAVAGRQIATIAKERGTTDNGSLKRIADELGFELSGDAQLETVTTPGALYGTNPVKDKVTKQPLMSLKGNFSLKPKPTTKTTRKGSPGSTPPGGPAKSELDAVLDKFNLR